jgi:hypothetical protein
VSRSALCALFPTLRYMQKWAILRARRPCVLHLALSGLGWHGRPDCHAPAVRPAAARP